MKAEDIKKMGYKIPTTDFNKLAGEMGVDISLYPHLRAGFKKLTKDKQRRYRELQKKWEEYMEKLSKFNVGVTDNNPPKEFSDLQRKANAEIYSAMEELEAEMQSLQPQEELQEELQKHEALLGKFRELSEKELKAKDKKVAKLEAKIKKLTTPKEKIKLPRKTYEVTRAIFAPERIPSKQLTLAFEEGDENYSYKWDTLHHEVTYIIPKEFIDNQLPSLPLMREAYLMSIIMAEEQRSPTFEFPIGEKLKRLGYKEATGRRGGKIYKKMALAEKGLAGLTFQYKNKKRGKEYMELIGSLCTLEVRGEGKTAIYEVTLNSKFLEGLDFETGKIKDQRVEIPVKLLTDRSMSHYEVNVYMSLLRYIGLPRITPFGSRFLDWAELPPSRRKKKSYRNKIYDIVRAVFRDMGFKVQEIDYRGKAKDFTEWKFIITPPESAKRTGKKYRELDDKAKEFIEEATEWQARSDDRRSKEEIKRLFTHIVLSDGLEATQDLFNAVNTTTDPTPFHFWTERRQRKVAKEEGYDLSGLNPSQRAQLERDGEIGEF